MTMNTSPSGRPFMPIVPPGTDWETMQNHMRRYWDEERAHNGPRTTTGDGGTVTPE